MYARMCRHIRNIRVWIRNIRVWICRWSIFTKTVGSLLGLTRLDAFWAWLGWKPSGPDSVGSLLGLHIVLTYPLTCAVNVCWLILPNEICKSRGKSIWFDVKGGLTCPLTCPVIAPWPIPPNELGKSRDKSIGFDVHWGLTCPLTCPWIARWIISPNEFGKSMGKSIGFDAHCGLTCPLTCPPIIMRCRVRT